MSCDDGRDLECLPPVAAAAAQVPVLGGLFQVLTVRTYHTAEDGIHYNVDAPGVVSDGDLSQRVNAEIQERVDALTAQAQQDWESYREAFFETGGTQEQWGDREMNVIVDYAIKFQSDTAVSFTVDFGEGWVSASQERYCYNLDLSEDRDITLQDVLGENWVELCNTAAQNYIAENTDENRFTLFFEPKWADLLQWMRIPHFISARTVCRSWYSGVHHCYRRRRHCGDPGRDMILRGGSNQRAAAKAAALWFILWWQKRCKLLMIPCTAVKEPL